MEIILFLLPAQYFNDSDCLRMCGLTEYAVFSVLYCQPLLRLPGVGGGALGSGLLMSSLLSDCEIKIHLTMILSWGGSWQHTGGEPRQHRKSS